MLTRPFKLTKFIAFSVAFALLAQPFALAQGEQTRPRRVGTDAPVASPTRPARDDVTIKRLDAEPTIRIGLSTSARSVTISTSGQALSVLQTQPGETNAPAALSVSRVRIEPRMLAPLPAPQADEGRLFRVEIAAVTSAAQAETIAREVRELTGDAPEVVQDTAAATWRVRVGLPAPRAEAEELRTRLEEEGIAAVSLVGAQPSASSTQEIAARTSSNTRQPAATRSPNQTPTARANTSSTRANPNGTTSARRAPSGSPAQSGNGVRLASRSLSLPARGLVVYAGGTSPLLDSRAPVTFAPTEANAPLRFNEKPYRGRLEVFTNLNGSLTV
ncbi:MAG TPA: SPOR domain-containing protein, partial [Pyrinomonadaceae bacterium]|nr:SPOR domain-containing protein [Pyrinomonadaceae bacterium]